jgi:hypothetical protein
MEDRRSCEARLSRRLEQDGSWKRAPRSTSTACLAVLDLWASRFPNVKPEHFVFAACETGQIDAEQPISHWRSEWRHAGRNGS